MADKISSKEKSVVKTTDLLYVFCAAAWVAVLATNFEDIVSFSCLSLAFLTFSLIPLEIYTGDLWQQAVHLIDRDPTDDAFQKSILATVDIARVFFLTIVFLLLHIPMNILKDISPQSHEQLSSLETYMCCISFYLLLNWIWNNILFRGKFTDESGKNYYDEIIEMYRISTSSAHGNVGVRVDPELAHYRKFAYKYTMTFGLLNWVVFQILFPIIALLLLILSITSSKYKDVHDIATLWIGSTSILVFGLQIMAKILQITFFANIVSDIRAYRSSPQGGV